MRRWYNLSPVARVPFQEWRNGIISLCFIAGLLRFNRLDPVNNSDYPEDVRRWPSM